MRPAAIAIALLVAVWRAGAQAPEPLPEALDADGRGRARLRRACARHRLERCLPRVLRPERGRIRRRSARIGARADRQESRPAQGSAIDLGAALRRRRRQRRARLSHRSGAQRARLTRRRQTPPFELRLDVEAAADGSFKVVMDVGINTPSAVPFASRLLRAPHKNRFTGDYDDSTPPLGTADEAAEQRAEDQPAERLPAAPRRGRSLPSTEPDAHRRGAGRDQVARVAAGRSRAPTRGSPKWRAPATSATPGARSRLRRGR